MIVTKISYAVKAEYAAQNKENIIRVVNELRALQRTDIKYSVFVENDGKTFTHWFFCANEEAKKIFTTLEAFTVFQSELQSSNPIVSPVVTDLTLIGSSYDLL